MKKRFYIVGFLVLMAFDTLAQLSFKFAGEHALPLEFSTDWLLRVFGRPWIYGAIIGYIGAFFSWMTLLRHAPIGPAFAASHLEIVSVMALSVWLFNEPIGWAQVAGGLLILGGIVCLAFDETANASSDDGSSDNSSPVAPDGTAAPAAPAGVAGVAGSAGSVRSAGLAKH